MFTSLSYTVESVTAGYPDKVRDQISDAILDTHLAKDPSSRVAVETFGSHGLLIMGGEIISTHLNFILKPRHTVILENPVCRGKKL